MPRLINADALIAEAMKDGAYGYVDAEQIANAPTVDAEPVRHGHWIYDDEGYQCSVCGKSDYGNGLEILSGTYAYCPRCGAKMDEVENDR